MWTATTPPSNVLARRCFGAGLSWRWRAVCCPANALLAQRYRRHALSAVRLSAASGAMPSPYSARSDAVCVSMQYPTLKLMPTSPFYPDVSAIPVDARLSQVLDSVDQSLMGISGHQKWMGQALLGLSARVDAMDADHAAQHDVLKSYFDALKLEMVTAVRNVVSEVLASQPVGNRAPPLVSRALPHRPPSHPNAFSAAPSHTYSFHRGYAHTHGRPSNAGPSSAQWVPVSVGYPDDPMGEQGAFDGPDNATAVDDSVQGREGYVQVTIAYTCFSNVTSFSHLSP